MKILLAVLLSFSISHAQAISIVEPSESIDVKRYVFEISINDSTDLISGTAQLTFVPRKNVGEFTIDLIGKNEQAKGMEVTSITLNGSPLKFEHKNDRLNITLDRSRGSEELTVVINYRGVPRDGLIISKNKYGDRTFFADNWPDRGRNWLPIVDHPSDKAAVEWIVKSPLHYEVVANGVKVEESFLSEKQKVTRYVEDIEIATKVMVIGAARFAIEQAGVVNNNIPVESWVYPQNRKEGFYDYAVATKILDYFIKNIGPYSYKKLANVQSKTTFGGLENASAIFYTESSVNGKNDHVGLIAHEIAHQWFGNSATEKQWHHIWLSEGFATYFAALYMESAYGVEKLKEELRQDRQQAIGHFKKSQAPIVDPTVTDWMKLLNPNSYQKGGWVLHMLRRDIGDEKFWKGVQSYYKKYQNSNADTDDFKNEMEAASGKDLDEFFNQWLYKSGHPVLDGTWTYDAKTKTVQIDLKQIQKTQVFKFAVEIAIYEGGKERPRIEKAQISAETTKLSFPSAVAPSKIELDPNVNLLFEGNLRH